jgi:hypothetical protein
VAQNKAGDSCYTLTFAQFQWYWALLRRLIELQSILDVSQSQLDDDNGINNTQQRTEHSVEDVTTDNTTVEELESECMICCDTIPDQHCTILHCGPTLCETCEHRCFKKNLVCPFCRQSFGNYSEAQGSGWHVADDSVNRDIRKDVQVLVRRIQSLWKEIAENEPLELDTSHTRYVAMERRIWIHDGEVDCNGNDATDEKGYTVVNVL